MASSQLIPQSIQPIIVEHTGPVDDEYYPIYNPIITVNVCSDNNANKMEIDDDNEYAKLLVTDEVKLTSNEKANCTIIYNASNELQIGDEIQFFGYGTKYRGNIINTTKYGSYTVSIKSTNDNQDINTYAVSKYSNIIRTKRKHESKLFHVIGNKEEYVFTKYLETILPKQPTSILQQIASFLFDKSLHRRSVYFDCKSFEKLVHTNHKPFHISDNNNINSTNHWLGYDSCYEWQIFELSKRGHPTFPCDEQRHEMYAQKPYLPKILAKDRIYLNIIQKKLNNALKTNVNLYKYQLHTVLWCYIIEQSVINKQRLCIGSNHLRFTGSNKCNVYNINNKFIPSNINRIIPPTFLTYKGGFICDDVGLGKTLTMLSLIASHTTNCIQLHNQLMNTNATLLIAPSHLIEQWKNECDKHFKNMNKIIIITTANQYKNVSYSDILSAQIVLVSLQFIGGTHYKFRILGANNREIERHRKYLNPLLPPKPKGYIEPKSNTNRSRSRSRSKPIEIKYRDIDKTEVFFNLIHWNRIILDEGHDDLSDEQSRNVIFNIDSNFKWYVSATPFPNNKSIAYAAEFLGIQFCEENKLNNFINWSENINEPIGNVLHCIIYYHLFSRHTKRSILDDDYLPNIQEKIECVQFHPIERLFYNIIQSRKLSKQNDELERQICSGVLRYFERNRDDEILNENNKYLQNLLNINVKYYKSEINQLYYDLQCAINSLDESKIYAKELIEIKKQFSHNPANYGITFTLTRYFDISSTVPGSPTAQQRRQYNKYVGINQKVQRFENEVKRIEKLMKFELPQLNKENEMIIYGNDKINEEIENFEKKFDNKLDGKILLEFVQTYGSKQAVLIEFIKKLHNENINNRIIVFSVFNETLKQIRNRLSKINVNAVSCTGSVHSRKIAMKSFQNNDIGSRDNTCENNGRIILLSSKNAASGANFNEATHVILCDQISGPSSESYAAEKQAIGRGVRQGMSGRNATKVIRFIVENTIEQEIFERNEKIRRNNNNNSDCDEWKVERSDSEIDFYMKINQMNELKGKDSKKRKRNNMNKRYDNDENINESNIGQPKQKRRRTNQ